jgi:hypothetical protein
MTNVYTVQVVCTVVVEADSIEEAKRLGKIEIADVSSVIHTHVNGAARSTYMEEN